MGSGNLEVFKFATYLFVPLFAMLHFGDPAWYEHHVAPVKEAIWPKYEDTHKPPRTAAELQTELARFKAQRQGRGAGAAAGTEQAEAGAGPAGTIAVAATGWADAARTIEMGGTAGQASTSGSRTDSGRDWAHGDRRWV
ncbi:hypothetical protein Q5752_001486 [Cryptotrichosporon argae]